MKFSLSSHTTGVQMAFLMYLSESHHTHQHMPMYHTYSDEDLIRLLYREVTAEEATQMKDALMTDESLAERWQSLRQVHKLLGSCNMTPSEDAIHIIMNYARKANTGIEQTI